MHVVRCSWKLQPDHVIPVTFDQVCLGMPKGLWYNNHQYLEKGLSLCCCFLHVVRHSWKLQFDHVIFLGFIQACSKCSEITNAKYLERWVIVLIFCMQLDIHMKHGCLPACLPMKQHACENSGSRVVSKNALGQWHCRIFLTLISQKLFKVWSSFFACG